MEADEYDKMHALEAELWWFRALRRNMLTVLNRMAGASGQTVLDAGCGTGGWLETLAVARPQDQRIGVEYDPRAARLAAGKAGCPILVGSVNQLPVADCTVNIITSSDVLCHAGVTPALALAEFHRVLAPDGRLLLNLPAYGWLMSAHDRRVHNARRFDPGAVRGLLHQHGFVLERLEFWNCILFPLMVGKRLLSSNDAASDVALLPAPVEYLFDLTCRLETGMIEWGWQLPWGGSLLVSARKLTLS